MKKSIVFLIFINLVSSLTGQYIVSGGSGIPLRGVNDITNRTEVYLLNGLSGARISYFASEPGTHQWYRYRNSINDLEPVFSYQDGNMSYITDVRDGYGYFVGMPTKIEQHYVWIIDYSRYIPRFINIKTVTGDDKCEFLKILTEAEVESETLPFNLPSETPRTLYIDRKYQIQYYTQDWNEDNRQFVIVEKNIELKNDQIFEFVIDAPLINTHFTLSGDQYAEYFGIPQMIRSDEYDAIAVKAYGFAETDKEHADNEQHHSGDALGGSAPIEYTFTAYANEPVAASYIWKILQYDSLTNQMTMKVRYTDKLLRYNFESEGRFRVELEVTNSTSACVDTTVFFNVIIDNTKIKIPNVFSPGSSIGANDELKISFTSVVSFKASVFNRWGNLLFQWSDPARGWDGRVNGVYVPTGVYYVVVEYKDSMGKNRTMSRAVNVLRAKN